MISKRLPAPILGNALYSTIVTPFQYATTVSANSYTSITSSTKIVKSRHFSILDEHLVNVQDAVVIKELESTQGYFDPEILKISSPAL